MATKAPQLVQRYVTGGDRKLKDWHLFLQRVTFGAALVLMSASVVSLHWACNLIGLRGWWEPVAWAVPLAMEGGMAAVASTATTIRKDAKAEGKPGGYYVSLWVIFSFVMLLAQASNIGHAVVTVAEGANGLPPVIPTEFVYFFACAFAALFPLGGTLFVHVSGFLRAHGTGARWIDDEAEVVYEQAAPGYASAQRPGQARAPKVPTARTPIPQPARTEPAHRAPETATSSAQPARTASAPAGSEQDAARALFDQKVAADPLTRPDASRLHDEAGLTCNKATSRRWVQKWWDDHQASLGTGGDDPIATQVAEDTERAAERADTSAA